MERTGKGRSFHREECGYLAEQVHGEVRLPRLGKVFQTEGLRLYPEENWGATG